jgi:hypothetical protein
MDFRDIAHEDVNWISSVKHPGYQEITSQVTHMHISVQDKVP